MKENENENQNENENANMPKLEKGTPEYQEGVKKLVVMEQELEQLCEQHSIHEATRNAAEARLKVLEGYEKSLKESQKDLQLAKLRLMMICNDTENLSLQANTLELAAQLNRASYNIQCGVIRLDMRIEQEKCLVTRSDAVTLMDEQTDKIEDLSRRISAMRVKLGLGEDDPIPDANANDNKNEKGKGGVAE